MSRALLWALAACLVGCPAPVVRRPEPPPVEIAKPPQAQLDPALGLLVPVGAGKMQVLAGWEAHPRQRDAWVAPRVPGQPHDGANFHALVGDPKPLTTPWEDHWRALRDEYRARAERVQTFVEDGPLEIDGLPGWFFRIEREEQGVSFGVYQVLLGTRDHTYFLTWSSRLDRYPEWAPLFARSARSFRLPRPSP